MSRRFSVQIESDVPNGTAPMIVDSSTLITNFNADLLDGQHGSYYAPLASPTFTGTVTLPTVSASGIFTTSNYINRTTANGNSSWLQQDGTGRVHWYWNTLGGTSPTFTNAGEDASAITQHVTLNGNGGSVFFRSANGVGASAGGPITWTTTLYVDLNNITYKGTPIALTVSPTFSKSGVTLVQVADGATISNAGQVNTLQVVQATANADAFMTFHVSGDYAAHFGIDGTTNDLAYGGWSAGAVKHRVWHAGNQSTLFTSPAFTGVPTAPTAASGTNTTQIATTAYVTTALASSTSGFEPFFLSGM